ncbi:MAG: T9SS type A sorting domain-containing protein [Winogradskyella sp.]|nr:T9SS type A sorting domain-containing protein [Winogradskyella sp.]
MQDISSQTYTTVADGPWEEPATWTGGVVPSNPIGAAEIVQIEHLVTLSTVWTNDGRIEVSTPASAVGSETVLNIQPAGIINNNNDIVILPGPTLPIVIYYISGSGIINNSGNFIANSADNGPSGTARIGGNLVNNIGAVIEIHDVAQFTDVTNFEGGLIRQFPQVQHQVYGQFFNSGEFDIQGGSFDVRNGGSLENEAAGIIYNSGRLSIGFFNGDILNNGRINNNAQGEIFLYDDANGLGSLDSTNGQIFNNGYVGGNGELLLLEESLFGTGEVSGNGFSSFFYPGVLDINSGSLREFGKISTRIESTEYETGYSSIDVLVGDIDIQNSNLKVIFESAYIPTLGDSFVLLSAYEGSITGEFTSFDFPSLPADLDFEVVYSPIEVTLLIVEANPSVQSGDFSDPNTWLNGVPGPTDSIIIGSGTTVTIDVAIAEGQNLTIQENATIVISEASQLDIVGDGMTSVVINEGTVDVVGTLNISNGTSGILNNGDIIVESTGTLTINNNINFGISNSGNFLLSGSTNIDNATVGLENNNDFTIEQDGDLTIDFTIDSAISTSLGSTFTNNGITFLGADTTTGNSLGLYGIDHRGYFVNSASGTLEINNSNEAGIYFPDGEPDIAGRNPNDGVFENNGGLTLNSMSLGAVDQSDSASQMKGKYTHILKKRPTPNPGRDIDDLASYIQQVLAFLNGTGNIESDITTFNGGIISPGGVLEEEGIIIFDGNEDLQNATLEIDVNGKTLKGTDYDLIAVIGALTIGGDINVDITYTPTTGDVITFIEASNLVGTFNSPSLPADWSIQYNLPNAGNVSLVFDDGLSIDENHLNNVNIYMQKETEEIIVSGTLFSSTTLKLYDMLGRLMTESELDINISTNTIEVSHLSTGYYIIELSSELNGTKSQKLIIN